MSNHGTLFEGKGVPAKRIYEERTVEWRAELVGGLEEQRCK